MTAEEMFTIKQLKQLSNYLVHDFKEVLATKEDLAEVNHRLTNVENMMDGLAKSHLRTEQELLVMGYRLGEHDKWITKAARASGVEYKP
jgi:K+/H+ antiporter YhaU regulatory subunit KhtT